jgi:hypothetical protein
MAGAHFLRRHGLGEFLRFHFLLDLSGDYALDRNCGGFLDHSHFVVKTVTKDLFAHVYAVLITVHRNRNESRMQILPHLEEHQSRE